MHGNHVKSHPTSSRHNAGFSTTCGWNTRSRSPCERGLRPVSGLADARPAGQKRGLGRFSSLPPLHESARWWRSASRPWLAAGWKLRGTWGEQMDHRAACVDAASQGRLALRWQCRDATRGLRQLCRRLTLGRGLSSPWAWCTRGPTFPRRSRRWRTFRPMGNPHRDEKNRQSERELKLGH